jgi:hypothetical protein
VSGPSCKAYGHERIVSSTTTRRNWIPRMSPNRSRAQQCERKNARASRSSSRNLRGQQSSIRTTNGILLQERRTRVRPRAHRAQTKGRCRKCPWPTHERHPWERFCREFWQGGFRRLADFQHQNRKAISSRKLHSFHK